MRSAVLPVREVHQAPPPVGGPAGWGRPLHAVLIVWSSLTCACGGNVSGNGPDAATEVDGGAAATVDAATSGSSADAATSGSSADASRDDAQDGYAGPCVISASSYDQSCKVDTDCSAVTSTNYCTANCLCGGSAIRVTALTQFNDDVSKTPLGSGSLGAGGRCPCPLFQGPCCRSGLCTATCPSVEPQLDASAAGHPFSCGTLTCASATQYCSIVNGHLPGMPATYACATSDGGTPSCGGSSLGMPGCGCYESASGEVTTTECPP